MAVINNLSQRIFGGNVENQSEPWAPATQTQGETVNVGTVRRRAKGPRNAAAGWSVHTRVTSAFGAGSTLKFYYSNLPDPDVTDLTQWVDSGITAVALTATGGTFTIKTDTTAEWLLLEVVSATTPGALWCYLRASDGPVIS